MKKLEKLGTLDFFLSLSESRFLLLQRLFAIEQLLLFLLEQIDFRGIPETRRLVERDRLLERIIACQPLVAAATARVVLRLVQTVLLLHLDVRRRVLFVQLSLDLRMLQEVVYGRSSRSLQRAAQWRLATSLSHCAKED